MPTDDTNGPACGLRNLMTIETNAGPLLTWADVLPQFASFTRDAAERAASLRKGLPFSLTIDHNRVAEENYRAHLIDEAKQWRGGRKTSTVYLLAYRRQISSDVIDPILRDAEEALGDIGETRAFPQRNGRPDSRCLYVGHALRFDRRLQEHLGGGHAKTSALNLKYWRRHPNVLLDVQAYAFEHDDIHVARMFEDYLWDRLGPLVGRRGGR